MKLYSLLLLTSLLTLVFSCKKSINDKEKPEVITFFLNTSNATTGGELSLNADIRDNNLLKSYKITVVNNFGFIADSIEETVRLGNVYVNQIEGKAVYSINNYSLPIPLNTSAGPYLFKLSVLDDKGNENTEKEVSFEITNPSDQPTINLSQPTNTSVYNQGDTIYAAGFIQDNVAIEEINFTCSNENGLFYSTQFLLDTTVVTSFNVATDGDVKIPVPFLAGNYTLITSVKDTVGNFKENFIDFSVN